MSKLGDILAESFQLKAQLIRARLGLAVKTAWMILAISYLVMRITIPYFILEAINAPTWVLVLFWIMIPVGMAVDQIELKSKELTK